MADIVDNEAVAYKSALQKTTRVMNEFRKLDPEMAIQQVQTFIFCALNEPKDISVKDIADSLGFSQASASRNIASFTSWNRHRRQGHGLLDTREDPMNRSRKVITLTPKGKLVAQAITEIIEK